MNLKGKCKHCLLYTSKMSADAILYGPKEYMGTKYAHLLELLERCPKEKGKYAEEMLTLYLLSHDPVE